METRRTFINDNIVAWDSRGTSYTATAFLRDGLGKKPAEEHISGSD
jgi:hypothetical protein